MSSSGEAPGHSRHIECAGEPEALHSARHLLRPEAGVAVPLQVNGSIINETLGAGTAKHSNSPQRLWLCEKGIYTK
jgi:hypothetical protein